MLGEFLNSFLKIKIFKKFYCFEPQKEIYKNLKKKFKNNKKIKLYNYSLGDSQSKKKMYLSNLLLFLLCPRLIRSLIGLKLKI